MHRAASFDPASTPWASNRSPNPGHVQRLVLVANGIERVIPRQQHFTRGRVKVGARGLIPDRQLVPAKRTIEVSGHNLLRRG